MGIRDEKQKADTSSLKMSMPNDISPLPSVKAREMSDSDEKVSFDCSVEPRNAKAHVTLDTLRAPVGGEV